MSQESRYRRPKQRQAEVQMRDVARMAGVSTQTVSRYFRKPETIGTENKERIAKAVAETGYFPNPAASSLSANRTNLVAVIVPTIDHSIFSEIVSGLSSVLENENYSLLIADNGFSLEKEEKLIERFLVYKVSGIVLIGQLHSERTRDLLRASGTPTVELLECDAPPIDMTIGFSNLSASYELTMGLIERGKRNIGFISALPTGNDRVQQRLKGFHAALKDAGLTAKPEHVAHADFAIENGARAFEKMYEKAPEIDAIVSNDILGLGVQLQCARMNLAVPEDIAITGFDNLEISSILETRLTTVNIESRAMGVAAGKQLLARQGNKDREEPCVDLRYEILWRETTS
ncbi:LacI family DNA-binding transcriptional regulator [Octadecabacter sp. G9-8]|uniref:LacI family DNA-binding transcriptional regulator n=1 Tax=Octadecabacter dasysiphoniae TaxID=2909341 RepID=A0ABS9CT53_9RHOB|nr:LacI family DNA-binding transcriptional regulator [Octadecabacter dasysiphoniae]MCF2870410.1 LacI family DNA-binding transcriptional regulator [Octadecabacter dasysiphoniae]